MGWSPIRACYHLRRRRKKPLGRWLGNAAESATTREQQGGPGLVFELRFCFVSSRVFRTEGRHGRHCLADRRRHRVCRIATLHKSPATNETRLCRHRNLLCVHFVSVCHCGCLLCVCVSALRDDESTLSERTATPKATAKPRWDSTLLLFFSTPSLICHGSAGALSCPTLRRNELSVAGDQFGGPPTFITIRIVNIPSENSWRKYGSNSITIPLGFHSMKEKDGLCWEMNCRHRMCDLFRMNLFFSCQSHDFFDISSSHTIKNASPKFEPVDSKRDAASAFHRALHVESWPGKNFCASPNLHAHSSPYFGRWRSRPFDTSPRPSRAVLQTPSTFGLAVITSKGRLTFGDLNFFVFSPSRETVSEPPWTRG